MKPATRAVLDLLRVHGADGVTPAEARKYLACDRLAARVWELRKLHGFDVDDVRERTPMGATHARYYLREPRHVPTEGTQMEALL